MTDTREPSAATAGNGPLTAKTTDADTERTVLRDLVELCAQCADEEARLEDGHATGRREEDEAHARTVQRIERNRDEQQADVRAKHDQWLQQVEQKCQAELAGLNEATESRRRRIAQEKSAVEHGVKEQVGKAVWLSESVLEGAQMALREGIKKANEDHDLRLEDLDELETETSALLVRNGPRSADLMRLPPDLPPPAEPPASFEAALEKARRHLAEMRSLRVAGLLSGIWPPLGGVLLCLLAGAAAHLATGQSRPDWLVIGAAAGGTLGALVLAALILSVVSRKQVRHAYAPLRQALDAARGMVEQELNDAKTRLQNDYLAAKAKCRDEKQAIQERFGPVHQQAAERYAAEMKSLEADHARKSATMTARRDDRRQRADAKLAKVAEEIHRGREADLQSARQAHEARVAEMDGDYATRRAALEKRWSTGLARVQTPGSADADAGQPGVPGDWSPQAWADWQLPSDFPRGIRFGELHVDLKLLTDKAPRSLALPESFFVPALLPFPRSSSLVVHSDHVGRAQAIRTLQVVMVRLLTSVPPGRVRFTILDPVGLGQNFAGFMHLADHDESLVGSRIWTEREHIDRQLADLTEHMETVIQKYLRNEFSTIDEYNEQAGELAEPYRFLVVADFPTGFEADAYRRLASIATTGARCGVFILMLRDTRQALPPDSHLEELEAHSVNLVRQGSPGQFVWKDEVFRNFPLKLDEPPDDRLLTSILDRVGRASMESKRVEVPFASVTPPRRELWSGVSGEEMRVPVGRLGATRLQSLRLGKGLAQHVLIAGKTGSGKSNLLHTIVTNAAMWYSPDELEFYLVDFKKGVEFKSFVRRSLPHARAIAVESDREFGLSILQRVDAELTRRGAMFRDLGVQDLPAYRRASGRTLPRTLLIVDEFQEFFSEDDRLSQEATGLLDRLVRQGRAFGIHVILGSQTIGGSSGLARSTLGQIAVRIALQCGEADSQLILGDDNPAARLLSRPGEAIYNDAGGLVEGNRPFQVAYLPDAQEDACLAEVQSLARERGIAGEPPIVFEGNAPADILKNRRLAAVLDGHDWLPPTSAPLAWIGEPVAIKDPTAVAFRRQMGANMLIIGQQDDSALSVLCSSVVSLAAQLPPGSARFVLLDGAPADSPLVGTLGRVAEALPHPSKVVAFRAVPEAMNELAEELAARQASEQPAAESIFVIIYGLQRYHVLRRQEDDFSFSRSDEPQAAKPDKQLADLLAEGPPLGIHVLAWADTPISTERALDRGSMRSFDNRVLFQMSAADSSNLVDSPLANKLGFHRALFYSEEQGTTEKLRPYALPSDQWLDRVRQVLRARQES